MNANLVGALAFGVVIGWVTYRTLRRTKPNGLSDIATVIGAVGGAAITALFPKESEAFGWYGIGLCIGFFAYLIVARTVAKTEGKPVDEWLGETPPIALVARGGSGGLERVG